MKRIILLLITSLLFSKEIILKKEIKETNNTLLQKKESIKIWILRKINSFTPEFLNISTDESTINFKLSYDTKTKKITSTLNAKLILPSIEKTTSKINFLQNTNTKTYKFKITPLLLIHKKILTPTIKTLFSIKNDYITTSNEIAETIYYYFIHNEYKETTSFAINKILNLNNLKFKVSKTYYSKYKSNLFYLAGVYYYTTTSKFIRTYGFEVSGERKKLPFIYQYKLLFDYRHTLFNKKFIYFDITPYLYASKDNHYSIKPALNISFNIKF